MSDTTKDAVPSDQRKPLNGWRTWGDDNDRCGHCCNGDRCDDRTHLDRRTCGYCLGTGDALWLKYRDAAPSTRDQS